MRLDSQPLRRRQEPTPAGIYRHPNKNLPQPASSSSCLQVAPPVKFLRCLLRIYYLWFPPERYRMQTLKTHRNQLQVMLARSNLPPWIDINGHAVILTHLKAVNKNAEGCNINRTIGLQNLNSPGPRSEACFDTTSPNCSPFPSRRTLDMDIIAACAQFAPVPYLGVVVSVVQQIIKTIDDVKIFKMQFEDLAQTMHWLPFWLSYTINTRKTLARRTRWRSLISIYWTS